MDIERLKTLKLEKDDVLLVEVDLGSLPPNRITQWMNEIREVIKSALGPVPVMIIPMHRVRISAINVQDAVVKAATSSSVNT